MPAILTLLLFAIPGIGNPEKFLASLEEAGVEVAGKEIFPDHYFYRAEDLANLAERAGNAGARRLVTTEKDAVKIDPAWTGKMPLDVLRIEAEFPGAEDRLMDLVLGARSKG